MIYLKDNLRYQNVISKRYCVDYKNIGNCIKSYEKELKDSGITGKGPLIIAFYDFSEDGPVEIELFLPVESSRVMPNDMEFHSYYSVEHMASSVVKTNPEKNTLPVLYMIKSMLNSMSCKIISPIYFEYDNVFEQNIVTIKVAYTKDVDQEN